MLWLRRGSHQFIREVPPCTPPDVGRVSSAPIFFLRGSTWHLGAARTSTAQMATAVEAPPPPSAFECKHAFHSEHGCGVRVEMDVVPATGAGQALYAFRFAPDPQASVTSARPARPSRGANPLSWRRPLPPGAASRAPLSPS